MKVQNRECLLPLACQLFFVLLRQHRTIHGFSFDGTSVPSELCGVALSKTEETVDAQIHSSGKGGGICLHQICFCGSGDKADFNERCGHGGFS